MKSLKFLRKFIFLIILGILSLSYTSWANEKETSLNLELEQLKDFVGSCNSQKLFSYQLKNRPSCSAIWAPAADTSSLGNLKVVSNHVLSTYNNIMYDTENIENQIREILPKDKEWSSFASFFNSEASRENSSILEKILIKNNSQDPSKEENETDSISTNDSDSDSEEEKKMKKLHDQFKDFSCIYSYLYSNEWHNDYINEDVKLLKDFLRKNSLFYINLSIPFLPSKPSERKTVSLLWTPSSEWGELSFCPPEVIPHLTSFSPPIRKIIPANGNWPTLIQCFNEAQKNRPLIDTKRDFFIGVKKALEDLQNQTNTCSRDTQVPQTKGAINQETRISEASDPSSSQKSLGMGFNKTMGVKKALEDVQNQANTCSRDTQVPQIKGAINQETGTSEASDPSSSQKPLGMGFNKKTVAAAGAAGLVGVGFDFLIGKPIQERVSQWIEGTSSSLEDKREQQEKKLFWTGKKIGGIVRGGLDLLVGGTTFGVILWIFEKK
jgi:hypothetical protein